MNVVGKYCMNDLFIDVIGNEQLMCNVMAI